MQAFIPHTLPAASRPAARHNAPRMSAPPESVVEPFYPAVRRFQAPYISFTKSSIIVDMAEVPLPPSTGADPDAPNPDLYSKFMPKADSEAPFLEITPPSSFVSMSMQVTADSPGLRDPVEQPDPSLYNKFFGSEGRPMFVAPFIDVVDQSGGVGLEMKEVEADAPVEDVDPSKYAPYMGIGALNKAPFITLGDDVIKVEMRDVDGDANLEGDAAGEKMNFREKGGVNSAPFITFPDGNAGVQVEYNTVSGYDTGLNCAPVIEFDGLEGISLKMTAIEGDYEAVPTSQAENAASKAYSYGWKPRSVLEKVYV